MALTLADYQNIILNTSWEGQSPPTGLVATDIFNRAARFLCFQHAWSWLNVVPTTLNLTISQAYIALPTDFQHLISVRAASDSVFGIEPATIDEILEWRGLTGATSLTYKYALVWPTQTSATTARGVQRMEIWPTPSASVTAAFNLQYRQGWVDLAAGSTTYIPNIPVRYEGILWQLCQHFATEYLSMGRSPGVARSLAPSLLLELQQLKVSDGLSQPSYGVMRGNGIVKRRSGSDWPVLGTVTG